jgi:hypothetical protein
LTSDKVDGGGGGVVIDRFHPLPGQGPGVFDSAVGERPDHAARPEGLPEGPAVGEFQVAGVVLVFRFFFGVSMAFLPVLAFSWVTMPT